jgi:hypothetical protein
MRDISELGGIVAGAFPRPHQVGHGEYLPLVGDFMSFHEIIDTLNDRVTTSLSIKCRRKFSRVSFLEPLR